MPNVSKKYFAHDRPCSICGKSMLNTPPGEWTYHTHQKNMPYHKACLGNTSTATPTPPVNTTPYNPDWAKDAKEKIKQGEMLQAIRIIRDNYTWPTPYSLAESKYLAERWRNELQVTATPIPALKPIPTPAKVHSGYHKQYATLLKLARARCDCYLAGAPGSGKTYSIKQVSKELSLRYGYIALSEATMPSQIFGHMDAMSHYSSTIFYDFYKNGGVLDIAELDNTNANVFTLFNNALDNGEASFPCGMVPRHPDFICVANGNTNLRGPNAMFPARQRQDAASIERFVLVEWIYDTELELALFPKHEKVIKWCHALRAAVDQRKDQLVVSLRCMRNLVRLLDAGFPLETAANMAIFKLYQATKELKQAVPFPTGY